MRQEKDPYQIGEVAQQSETSVDTIRYYEKLGLLGKTDRSTGGFRLYGSETIEKLRFIKKAQHFGLSLSEIKRILQESERGLEKCCSYVGQLLGKKLEELEARIHELHQMKKDLKSLMKGWIPLEEAEKRTYTICPQLENERIDKKSKKKKS